MILMPFLCIDISHNYEIWLSFHIHLDQPVIFLVLLRLLYVAINNIENIIMTNLFPIS